MKLKYSPISMYAYVSLFVLLLVSFVGMHIYCVQCSKVLHTYTFTSENRNITQDQLSISVVVSKHWNDDALNPDKPCGAQYDGVLSNQSGLTFKDWSAELTFSEPLFIDSSWNGVFSANGNKVMFVAQGASAIAAPYSKTTFGAVMNSKELMTLKSYVLSGYRIISETDLKLFWMLITLSAVWVIAVFMHIVIYLRTERFRRRQELDTAIIRQSMNTFISFIDAKDPCTKGHSVRVAEYSSEIARRMNMDEEQVTQIYYIALMHDCGKIGVPDAVLGKPGKLTEDEYKLIQAHTVIGDAILLNFTAIPNIRDGAHFHHERFDGNGYPSGLNGAAIPLCARILCVADSFDAMSSNRCYRSQLSEDKIMSELTENAGKQFDPEIVPFMVEMIQDGFVKQIQAQYPNITIDVSSVNQ